jgi:SAM-dependent methyltransferase
MRPNIELTDPRTDFAAVEPFLHGLGFDIGAGTNRLSPTVLCSDWYPHKGVDLIWNCVHEGGWYPYPFMPNTFDFIFASHVLEDFHPNVTQKVFDEWLRMVKIGGYLVILIPDMEAGRYAKWDEKFTETHPDVISGKRKVGDTIGNPAHLQDAGLNMMQKLVENSVYKIEVVQKDTIPHSSMTLDFVIKKI